jgi:geranylgeranyl pyrophosphate synthase
LPLLVSLQRAPKDESEHIRQLATDLAHNAPYLDAHEAEEEIKAFVMRYDGVRYAYKQMQAYKEKALKALRAFRDSDVKRSLTVLLDYAINRLY